MKFYQVTDNGKMGILESSHTLSFFLEFSICAAGRFFGRLTSVPWFQVAPTIELVEYSVALQNLRTLILDTCNLHNNFGLLHHCLRNTSNLEKLTLQYCKVLHFSISLILHNCSIYLVISNLLKSFMMERFQMVPLEGKAMPRQRRRSLKTWCLCTVPS